MSAFDATAFQNTEYTEANDTLVVTFSEGDYPGQIKKYDLKMPKDRLVCEIIWVIDDEEARNITGMDEPTARQSLWLDTNEQGLLDMGKGKNVQLGKLREALGLNVPGKPFSFPALIGQTAIVSTKHRINDAGDTFSDVKAVRAA